ncbi:MAG: hypothetical protein SF097_22325 [Acidobacteriota bacterium]|nr:hypothetical protein [Acidobacteriota bacterium]
MTAITFESVLAQAESLPTPQQIRLIDALRQSLEQTKPEPLSSSEEERRARVRALRGKYRGSLSSVDEFLAAKREEVELEEARYLARHPEEAKQ